MKIIILSSDESRYVIDNFFSLDDEFPPASDAELFHASLARRENPICCDEHVHPKPEGADDDTPWVIGCGLPRGHPGLHEGRIPVSEYVTWGDHRNPGEKT